jgi:copper chaperone CopZ
METIKHSIVIQNLKCGGCANTVTKELMALQGVSNVTVDDETSIVRFEAPESQLPEVTERLSQLGYPAADDANSFMKKATSYVSCVRGRM